MVDVVCLCAHHLIQFFCLGENKKIIQEMKYTKKCKVKKKLPTHNWKNKWNAHKSSVDFVDVVVRVHTLSYTHLMTEYIKSKWKQDWIMSAWALDRRGCVSTMYCESRVYSVLWSTHKRAHSLYEYNLAKLIIWLKCVCARALCALRLANTVYRPSFINKIVQTSLARHEIETEK